MCGEKLKKLTSAVCGLLLAASPISSAWAATTTSNFNSSITLNGTCQIFFTFNLNFGTHGILNSNVDALSAVIFRCTNGVNYDIGLDAGTTPGGTTSVRKMQNGTNTIDYQLFMNGARTINWGDTIGTDTLSFTGSGGFQLAYIYGRVPAQSTPASGTYTDTVTITITY